MMNVNEIKATGIYKELVNKAQTVEDFIEKTDKALQSVADKAEIERLNALRDRLENELEFAYERIDELFLVD